MTIRGYSRKHYALIANGGPDAPGEAEERIRRRKASELAHADMLAKYAPLSAENAMDAIRYQEERIDHHLAALAAEHDGPRGQQGGRGVRGGVARATT